MAISRRTRLGRFTLVSAALHAAGFTLPFVGFALRLPGCHAHGGDDDPADVIELVLREEQPTRPDARQDHMSPPAARASEAAGSATAGRPKPHSAATRAAGEPAARREARPPRERRADRRDERRRTEPSLPLPVERDPAELLALLIPPADGSSGGSASAPSSVRTVSDVSALTARAGGLATSFETDLRRAAEGARVGRPEIERQPSLEYPPEALRKREQGMVTVRLLIDSRGGVPIAYVKTTSSSRALDRAALAYAGGLRFRPVLDETGRPVWGWLNLDVRFHVREPGSAPLALGEARRRP